MVSISVHTLDVHSMSKSNILSESFCHAAPSGSDGCVSDLGLP